MWVVPISGRVGGWVTYALEGSVSDAQADSFQSEAGETAQWLGTLVIGKLLGSSAHIRRLTTARDSNSRTVSVLFLPLWALHTIVTQTNKLKSTYVTKKLTHHHTTDTQAFMHTVIHTPSNF